MASIKNIDSLPSINDNIPLGYGDGASMPTLSQGSAFVEVAYSPNPGISTYESFKYRITGIGDDISGNASLMPNNNAIHRYVEASIAPINDAIDDMSSTYGDNISSISNEMNSMLPAPVVEQINGTSISTISCHILSNSMVRFCYDEQEDAVVVSNGSTLCCNIESYLTDVCVILSCDDGTNGMLRNFTMLMQFNDDASLTSRQLYVESVTDALSIYVVDEHSLVDLSSEGSYVSDASNCRFEVLKFNEIAPHMFTMSQLICNA